MAKILHAEDDNFIRTSLKRLLEYEEHGHNVTSVEDGQLAVARLVEDGEEFDLVILDNRMPKLSGLETINVLREAGIKTPVILLSSDVDSSNMPSYLEFGFQYAIRKNDFDGLFAAIAAIESTFSD